MSHPNLIAGIEHCDDAGVYKIRDDLALIQTVDFFTPIVDDPYTFGQVAAANALSDVYAMGGEPLTALNIICFPINSMDISILQQVLKGGLEKMREAGVLLVGGHSVEDKEIKYGLSVTGTVHPEKVLLNRGALAGDALILTKPLGTGIINTALKAKMAPDALVEKAVHSMGELNKKAAALMTTCPNVHACTDITGFGLLGHAAEMIEDSDVGIVIFSASVPIFAEVKEYVETGIVPGGLHRNRKFREQMVKQAPTCPDWIMDVLYDPQTSGGLLISLPVIDAEALVKAMRKAGIQAAAIVGRILPDPKGKIIVE
ncbi:MAG: selenide, water dikinase SelD [Syntrophales bacterium]|jgi:selenide,water dikinase|nr:selenide, water dikinase SelD [Syntrophales bacterium]